MPPAQDQLADPCLQLPIEESETVQPVSRGETNTASLIHTCRSIIFETSLTLMAETSVKVYRAVAYRHK